MNRYLQSYLFYLLISKLYGGVEITLCKIREEYWIVLGRQNVPTLLKKCYVCKIVQEKH